MEKKNIYIYLCSAPGFETEEKLWGLWNVDLHREALEYINTRATFNVQRKARGRYVCKRRRGLKSTPWVLCCIPK
jgi:hypothetical protein